MMRQVFTRKKVFCDVTKQAASGAKKRDAMHLIMRQERKSLHGQSSARRANRARKLTLYIPGIACGRRVRARSHKALLISNRPKNHLPLSKADYTSYKSTLVLSSV
jgi:hypothetical protein